jgi:hypothetical protein
MVAHAGGARNGVSRGTSCIPKGSSLKDLREFVRSRSVFDLQSVDSQGRFLPVTHRDAQRTSMCSALAASVSFVRHNSIG